MSKAPSSTNKQKSGQKSSKVARTSDDSDDGLMILMMALKSTQAASPKSTEKKVPKPRKGTAPKPPTQLNWSQLLKITMTTSSQGKAASLVRRKHAPSPIKEARNLFILKVTTSSHQMTRM